MLQTELIKAEQAGSPWLLIVLHGLGDSMEGYRWVPRMLHFPELNYLLVNAPDAFYGGFSWYEFTGREGLGIERSYRLLEKLLDDLATKGHPPERILMFGFSQGCLMTIETAMRYPHRLAGCIGVSGYVHEPERLIQNLSPVAKQQKLLVTHGTRDGLLPMSRVRSGIDPLLAGGIQIDFREYEKDHELIEPEIELFRRFIQERMQDSANPAPRTGTGG